MPDHDGYLTVRVLVHVFTKSQIVTKLAFTEKHSTVIQLKFEHLFKFILLW